jgi:hypothetical protein
MGRPKLKTRDWRFVSAETAEAERHRHLFHLEKSGAPSARGEEMDGDNLYAFP